MCQVPRFVIFKAGKIEYYLIPIKIIPKLNAPEFLKFLIILLKIFLNEQLQISTIFNFILLLNSFVSKQR